MPTDDSSTAVAIFLVLAILTTVLAIYTYTPGVTIFE